MCRTNNYEKLEQFIEKLIHEAYAASQILEQLNDLIVDTDEFNDKQKEIIGEKLGVS